MVERQLRGRDIVDERGAAGDGASAARAVRARGGAAPRLRRRGAAVGPRPDDLPAVHGRAHLRGAGAARRRAGARRRHGLRLPGRSAGRAGDGGDTIERIPELAEPRGRASPRRATRPSRSLVGDGTLGVPERAPFDAIAVAAAAPELPETLYEQLRPRGRLVVPVGGQRAQRLEVIIRSPEGPAVVHSVPCRFVPLLGEEGFRR